jgi:hypothetical protein
MDPAHHHREAPSVAVAMLICPPAPRVKASRPRSTVTSPVEMSSPADSPLPLHSVAILDRRWLALVDSDPRATAFHHPAWARLVERCYGWSTFVLAEMTSDGTICAGVPVAEVSNWPRRRRWITLPYVDHCPPLGSFTSQHELPTSLARCRDRSGVSTFEVRTEIEGPGVHHRSLWVRHVLPLLDDPEEQFKAFHRMTRRNVRQSEGSGLVVRQEDQAEALVETFYGLHVGTRKRLGVPVQPKRFFRLLWEEFIAAGRGFVLVAYAGSRPAAAAVFLTWNGNLIYKFGASDPDAWHARPNNLLFWHAIRSAIENGDRELDFGRSEIHQDGLRTFKSGWGAREETLTYSYVSDRPPPGASRSPALVSATIRRSPSWVARGLGELLYRFAA